MDNVEFPNSLAEYLTEIGVDQDLALNILQTEGVISDNCISVSDVAEADCLKAIQFFEGKGLTNQ